MTTEPRRRVNVLYVSAVAELGGAERSLATLVENLDRESFRPRAVVPGRGPVSERLGRADVAVDLLPLRRFKRNARPWRRAADAASLFVNVCRLSRLIRRHRIDLVHANGYAALLYGAMAARLAGIPAIWHCRDLADLGRVGRFLCRRTSRIIAVSSAVVEHLQTCTNGIDKTRRVHNGIDPAPFADAGSAIDAPPVVGMVAQVVPWKRHDLFLAMAALVAEQFPEVRFQLAGGDLLGDHPTYEADLRRMADRLGLAERVDFLGHCDDIAATLAGWRIVVHPAATEPFGRCLVEAMLAGRPVVAIDRAGPTDIVENGASGRLVAPDDPQALADAVASLLTDAETAARLANAGRRRAEELFGVPRHVEAIEELYRETLEIGC